jgi:hypothetical protein
VYFVVYPEKDNAAKPELRVRFLKDGRVAATRKYALPAADSTGRIPSVIAGLGKPGNYEVRVNVVQGGATSEQSLRYTIAAK